SPEHRDLEVQQFYEVFLHRTAAPAERAGWVNVLLAGANETDVELAFINSQEYLAAHTDSASFVTGLYLDVLGRLPSDSEVSGWQQALANVMTRSAVTAAFLSSDEFDLRVLDGFYGRLLDRPLETGGAQGWLTWLRSGGSIETAAELLLSSDEYYQHLRS